MKRTRAPIVRAAAIHAVSVPLAWAVTPADFPWQLAATVCAVALVPVAGLGRWWMGINALFLPALTSVLALELSPQWALAGLVTLVFVYGAIWRSPVPLYFSSSRAQQALAGLLPADRPITFLDVGCGDGRVLAHLAASRPESRFEGIEHAVGPWFAARLRCGRRPRQCSIVRGDLWTRTLTQYDVVYAFLSPAVMERLWHKAQREMRPGALLVSAFGVPNVTPERHVDVRDAVRTRLYVWRIGFEGQT